LWKKDKLIFLFHAGEGGGRGGGKEYFHVFKRAIPFHLVVKSRKCRPLFEREGKEGGLIPLIRDEWCSNLEQRKVDADLDEKGGRGVIMPHP